MRSDRERLEDILEAIANIEKCAQQVAASFQENELVQVWMLHHIQVIGEAASKITEQARALDPGIPWAQIVEVRNILIHDYSSA